MHLDLAACGVERQGAAADGWAVDGAGPPLERPDAGHELPEVEGLDQVVVRAGVEALDAIGRGIARGEHEHRRRAVVLPRPGHHLEAADAGHAPVDHGDVVLVEAQLIDRLVARRHGVDEVAGLLEALDKDLPEPAIVFRHENAHQFTRLGARAASAATGPTTAEAAATKSTAAEAAATEPAEAGGAPVGSRRRDRQRTSSHGAGAVLGADCRDALTGLERGGLDHCRRGHLHRGRNGNRLGRAGRPP